MRRGRETAKIKLVGPFIDEADYKRQWGKEYSKDPKRVALVQSPEYKMYMKEYNAAYRKRDGFKDNKNRYRQKSRILLRLEILNHYSSGSLTCAKCGYGDVRALDHIDNNGGEHRKAVGRRGATYDIYAELKRDNYPEGYQILCRNCNWIKEVESKSQRPCSITTAVSQEVSNG